MTALDAAVGSVVDMIDARHSATSVVAPIAPYMHTQPDRCSLAQHLARWLADRLDQRAAAGQAHFLIPMKAEDDETMELATAILVGVANHDPDAVCHVFHTLEVDQQTRVIAALLHAIEGMLR